MNSRRVNVMCVWRRSSSRPADQRRGGEDFPQGAGACLAAEVHIALVSFQRFRLELQATIAMQLERILHALSPCPHQLVSRENPHLRLRREEHRLLHRRALVAQIGGEQLRLQLHDELIDDREIACLHPQVHVAAKQVQQSRASGFEQPLRRSPDRRRQPGKCQL